ncbi:diguanylate cyclase domain-containing protein [Agrobacterium cavarae]|uniref:diguanylate cyclase domain-containing protein n=1 Tax=Agrobacterium cavarae TaxID=2528239 RepID=UPI003EE5C0E6
MRHLEEPEDVYTALVSELAYTVLPTSVMGLSIFVVGIFAFTSSGNPLFLYATIAGSLASTIKVVVMLRQRRRLWSHILTVDSAKRWERLHAVVTFIVAGSVATLGALMIQVAHNAFNLLGTALLFGYAAGVATRVSVRPYIAIGAITIAAVPITVSAAVMFDAAHLILTAMFSVFLAAGIQSVWHVYRTTSRQIILRLEMTKFARRDTLTGLHNRRALHEAFSVLESMAAGDGWLCIHCFDLDGFKSVNDQLGHAAGDEILSSIGERLTCIVDHPLIAARIGGDEFVVYQPDILDLRDATALAETIFQVCTAPYVIADREVSIGLSLGYAIGKTSACAPAELMKAADAAAYRAKHKGGGVERSFGFGHA